MSDGAVASIQLNLPIRLHDRSPSPDRLLAELLGQDYASLCDLPAGRSVEVLAKRLGVEVKRLPMETLGQLLADSTRPVVLLREDADPRRQRYTLAHELAHLLVCRASERRFVSPALREVTRCESISTLEWHVDRMRRSAKLEFVVSTRRLSSRSASRLALSLFVDGLHLSRATTSPSLALFARLRERQPAAVSTGPSAGILGYRSCHEIRASPTRDRPRERSRPVAPCTRS
ncbi:MAG: ImmA/IrrE family metallo-endopeptidase [Gemmatimonadetes bacterium]|nr:ImmA/IrrE family metallo-endopeptidase [Gemmatimonadota bacterium]